MTCPFCQTPLTFEWARPRLSVALCLRCGHRLAQHEAAEPSVDYHDQYDAARFLPALQKTRERQAEAILTRLQPHGIDQGGLVDFGAGRGWFLEALRRRGVGSIGGIDTSRVAVDGLHAAGIESAPCVEQNGRLVFENTAFSFAPDFVAFLDVIEHFPPDRLLPHVNAVLDQLPSTRYVLVKVPVSEGLLFRLAGFFRRCGWTAPMEQLFQVGTHPPHIHYFSHQSLRLFFERLGADIIWQWDDPDFDDLFGRMKFLGGKLTAFSKGASQLAFLAAQAGGCDARTVLAAIRRRPASEEESEARLRYRTTASPESTGTPR